MKKVKVVQTEKEVPTEVIAESIIAISEGIKKLRGSRLNEKALVLLIQHASPYRSYNGGKISTSEVKSVLEGIESLEATFLKKKSNT